MRVLSLASFAFFALTGAVSAATLNESDVGGFSSGVGASGDINGTNGFTDVGRDFDLITGTLLDGEDDFLRFTDLDAGAQDFAFTVQLLSNANNAQASGTLRFFDTAPSGNSFTGGTTVGGFNLSPFGNASTTLSFSLPNSFAGGDLFVSVLSFSSNNLPYSYSLSATGNGGGPSPVPLPPAGLLLLAAFGGLAYRRRVRTSDLHLSPTQAT